jgi:hypothetical protein
VKYAEANARAMVAWVALAPLATWLLFLVLRPLLAKLPIPRSEPSVKETDPA